MESDRGSESTPRVPTASTTNRHRSSFFFRNRLSNASLLTLSSVRTLLPQYSVVDPTDESASPTSDVISPGPLRDRHSSWNSPTFGSVIQPPRYSLQNAPLTGRDSTATPIDSEIAQHEFRHSYPIRPKRPWATLHLHTRDAVPGNIQPLQTQPRVPRFWSCDPIKGTLELDLDSPQNIQQINIMLSGNIVISSHSDGSLQFLGHEFTVWDKSMGDPLPGQSDANRKQKKDFDGRFAPGQYAFPFSFPFPTHADPITKSAIFNANSISPFPSPTSGEPQSPSPTSHKDIPNSPETKRRSSWTSRFMSSGASPSGSHETASASSKAQPSSRMLPQTRHGFASSLPQSFMEKGINPNVAYEISVCIDHGRFRGSSRIKTKIAYFPASQPLPASQRRREAYEAGAFLPSPMDDPEGWLAWPTLAVYGVVNSGEKPRHTKAQCTVYVAQPSSYPRGSVIPCFLTISGDDEEVVDLLSNPKAPRLRLLRRIRHPMGDSDKSMAERVSQTGVFYGNGLSYEFTALPTGEMRLVTHEVGRAQWWYPPKAIEQGSDMRHLEGEIHLSPSLPPSCDFQFFQVEYAVELSSFQSENFEFEDHPSSPGKLRETDIVLASIPVKITTLCREDEPIPTAYSEPSHIQIMRRINSGGHRAAIFENENE